jgi:endonuclease YncB( thermonuclease family)
VIKKIVLLLLATIPTIALPNPYDYKIIRVIDGDTVVFEATFLPAPLKPQMSLRVLGIDTPEKGHRAQCESENQKAQEASKFTKNLIENAKKVQIEIKEHDKYGGRLLGDVIIDNRKLSEMLIEKGHARPYFGEKKSDWCK